MEAAITILTIIFGLWIGYRSHLRDEQHDRGKTCPVCNGTGMYRSGQWGGFTDRCMNCGGCGFL